MFFIILDVRGQRLHEAAGMDGHWVERTYASISGLLYIPTQLGHHNKRPDTLMMRSKNTATFISVHETMAELVSLLYRQAKGEMVKMTSGESKILMSNSEH